MLDLKIETEVLDILYEKWWHSTIVGYTEKEIFEKINADENRVSQALEILKSQFYIVQKDGWYKITTPLGIEIYEELLSPTLLTKKHTQRKMIMEILEEIYDKDTRAQMQHNELSTAVEIENFDELNAQMKYLESKGYIYLLEFMGKHFQAKLLADGKLALSGHEPQNYQSMVNAYRSIFIVETHLRKFIEAKLTKYYGAEWWNKGISHALQSKADKRKFDEQEYSWQVSNAKSNLEISFISRSK